MNTELGKIKAAMDALMLQRSTEAQEQGLDNDIIKAGQRALEALERSVGSVMMIQTEVTGEYRDADH